MAYNNLNRATLIGRLGKPPELRFTPEGRTPVCTFSVATTRKWKDQKTNEWKDDTTWHNIVIFGPNAERAAEFLHKGDLALIEGRIQNRNYKDKEGNTRYISEIVADTWMSFMPKPQGDRGAPPPEADIEGGGEPPIPTGAPPTDEFPF